MFAGFLSPASPHVALYPGSGPSLGDPCTPVSMQVRCFVTNSPWDVIPATCSLCIPTQLLG